jgi:hypothetical protein
LKLEGPWKGGGTEPAGNHVTHLRHLMWQSPWAKVEPNQSELMEHVSICSFGIPDRFLLAPQDQSLWVLVGHFRSWDLRFP